MHQALLMLGILLAGCSSAPDSRSERIEQTGPRPLHVPVVADRHEYGRPSSMKPGQWARYSVTRDGTEQEITLGVALREGERVWLEVTEEGDPRRASMRRVNADGRIDEALYREVTSKGESSLILIQTIMPGGEAAAERAPAPESVTTSTEEDKSLGRPLKVTIERVLYRDEELGREYREEHVWSEAVPPLFGGSAAGGLVRRDTPGVKVRLLDFGEGYSPAVPVDRWRRP